MIPQNTPRCFVPAAPESDRQNTGFKVIVVMVEVNCYSKEWCNCVSSLLGPCPACGDAGSAVLRHGMNV